MNWGIAMSDKDKAMAELEDLFATARRAPPRMPEAVATAILADAAGLQAERAEIASAQVSNPGHVKSARRFWTQFTNAVGGWPAVGGMVAANLSGLWIGLAPPSFLPDPVEQFAQFSSGSQLITYLGYDVSLLIGEEVTE